MPRAEVVKNSAKMNCLCFSNLNCKCSCRAGYSTSHLLMTKLEEIICNSPNFPCTNGGFLALHHLLQYLPHFSIQQLSVPTGLFDVLLCFSDGLEKSLKQSISQPWQTNKFGQNVLKITKSRGKKMSWWGNLKGSGSQSLSLQPSSLTPAQKVSPAAAGTCSVLYRKSAKPLKTKRSITCISTYGVLHELISANYLLKICKLKPCPLLMSY